MQKLAQWYAKEQPYIKHIRNTFKWGYTFVGESETWDTLILFSS